MFANICIHLNVSVQCHRCSDLLYRKDGRMHNVFITQFKKLLFSCFVSLKKLVG